MRTWFMVLSLILSFPAGLACDGVKAAFDCQDVCSRCKSCFDSSDDVGACRDRCRSKAEQDDSWQRKASSCSSCIDDKSCTSATFGCAADCVGIVP
jgi:hypothetical protein